jgi:hypothetical protein
VINKFILIQHRHANHLWASLDERGAAQARSLRLNTGQSSHARTACFLAKRRL